MRHLAFSLLLYVISASCYALAIDVSTKEKMAERLEIITYDNSLLPKDALQEVNEHIRLAEQKGWREISIEARTLKAELLSLLEDLPAAQEIVNETLPKAKQAQLNRLTIRLQLVLLGIYDSTGYNADVERHINDLLLSARQWGEQLEAGSIYNSVGHSYLMHGLLDKSLTYLKKAYNIFTKHEDNANLSYTLNSLANLYTDLGDNHTAIDYLLESLAINKSLNDKLSVSIISHNIGSTYSKMGSFEQAHVYLEESLKVAIEINDEIGIVWAQSAIASLFVKQKLPEKALTLFKKTAKTFEQNGDNRELFNARLGMFDSYLLLNDIDNATLQIPLLKALQAELNNSKYQLELDKREADLSYAKGNYQTAYQALTLYTEHVQQEHKKEKQQNLQNLKISFDVEIKENQNEILQKENEVQQLKLKQQNREQIIWFIMVGFAFTVTLFVCYLLIQQTQSRNRFKSMALRDHLTQAPNRRAILREAESTYQYCLANNATAKLAIIDLDKFKIINDSFGHDIGDEVLKAFANACQKSIRKHDHFGRYGGEEWLLVLSDTSDDDIKHIFTRLHKTINSDRYRELPDKLTINFSVGVTTIDRDRDLSLQQFIAEADSNLYLAKNHGRNQIHFGEQQFFLPTH